MILAYKAIRTVYFYFLIIYTMTYDIKSFVIFSNHLNWIWSIKVGAFTTVLLSTPIFQHFCFLIQPDLFPLFIAIAIIV